MPFQNLPVTTKEQRRRGGRGLNVLLIHYHTDDKKNIKNIAVRTLDDTGKGKRRGGATGRAAVCRFSSLSANHGTGWEAGGGAKLKKTSHLNYFLSEHHPATGSHIRGRGLERRLWLVSAGGRRIRGVWGGAGGGRG